MNIPALMMGCPWVTHLLQKNNPFKRKSSNPIFLRFLQALQFKGLLKKDRNLKKTKVWAKVKTLKVDNKSSLTIAQSIGLISRMMMINQDLLMVQKISYQKSTPRLKFQVQNKAHIFHKFPLKLSNHLSFHTTWERKKRMIFVWLHLKFLLIQNQN